MYSFGWIGVLVTNKATIHKYKLDIITKYNVKPKSEYSNLKYNPIIETPLAHKFKSELEKLPNTLSYDENWRIEYEKSLLVRGEY